MSKRRLTFMPLFVDIAASMKNAPEHFDKCIWIFPAESDVLDESIVCVELPRKCVAKNRIHLLPNLHTSRFVLLDACDDGLGCILTIFSVPDQDIEK